ncbi:MAG: DNA-directed RNA polymerase subunit omega [Clostridia bacterium]|jgi:DNA-directed RNA polymerase subunit K/omega|nr:DNA-directed RNA polymerase subunit omega [Clostridia bacterium]
MLHPSYEELRDFINKKEVKITTRYELVLAVSELARSLVESGELTEKEADEREVSVAIEKILEEKFELKSVE